MKQLPLGWYGFVGLTLGWDIWLYCHLLGPLKFPMTLACFKVSFSWKRWLTCYRFLNGWEVESPFVDCIWVNRNPSSSTGNLRRFWGAFLKITSRAMSSEYDRIHPEWLTTLEKQNQRTLGSWELIKVLEEPCNTKWWNHKGLYSSTFLSGCLFKPGRKMVNWHPKKRNHIWHPFGRSRWKPLGRMPSLQSHPDLHPVLNHGVVWCGTLAFPTGPQETTCVTLEFLHTDGLTQGGIHG